jgi:hypothetical protein
MIRAYYVLPHEKDRLIPPGQSDHTVEQFLLLPLFLLCRNGVPTLNDGNRGCNLGNEKID